MSGAAANVTVAGQSAIKLTGGITITMAANAQFAGQSALVIWEFTLGEDAIVSYAAKKEMSIMPGTSTVQNARVAARKDMISMTGAKTAKSVRVAL